MIRRQISYRFAPTSCMSQVQILASVLRDALLLVESAEVARRLHQASLANDGWRILHCQNLQLQPQSNFK